jgi:uncharacterized protein (TIGR02646 family)
MKKVCKSTEPQELSQYRNSHPHGDWARFKNSGGGKRYTAVANKLKSDQGGICAYCEIDLKSRSTQADHNDFRVEHFIPKSESTPQYNYHLDWSNLLGVCHGGSDRYVVDAADRFTSPDLHCDAYKDQYGINRSQDVLNPLSIPAFPPLFTFSRNVDSNKNGSMSVIPDNCTRSSLSFDKAQNTIDYLNLNSEKLKKSRGKVLNTLNNSLRAEIAKGTEMKAAIQKLCKIYLSRKADGTWSPFFSTIRAYLGIEAEEYLKLTNYCG